MARERHYGDSRELLVVARLGIWTLCPEIGVLRRGGNRLDSFIIGSGLFNHGQAKCVGQMELIDPATSMAQGGGPGFCLTLLSACRPDSGKNWDFRDSWVRWITGIFFQ